MLQLTVATLEKSLYHINNVVICLHRMKRKESSQNYVKRFYLLSFLFIVFVGSMAGNRLILILAEFRLLPRN